jgi:hypothetical protein
LPSQVVTFREIHSIKYTLYLGVDATSAAPHLSFYKVRAEPRRSTADYPWHECQNILAKLFNFAVIVLYY